MKRKSSEPDFEELPLFDLPLQDSERPRRSAAPLPTPPSASAPALAVQPPSRERTTAPTAAGPRPAAAEEEMDRERGAPAAKTRRGRENERELEAQDMAESVPASQLKASIGDRFFAGLADLLIHVATLGITALGVLLIGHHLTLKDLAPFVVFGLLFSFLYSVFSLAFWGQTPGMAWAGHLARSVTGEPLTFGQTVLRWMGGLFTLVLVGLPLLLVWAGGRSLSDRLSDSKTMQL